MIKIPGMVTAVSIATVFLKVVCVTMLMIIPASRAQLQPPLFGLIPPFLDQDVQQCWSSFRNVNGCLVEVYDSFISGKVVAIGPACCKAITEINADCWPKIFPFSSDFPPLLKAYCNGSQPPITLDSADDVSNTKELTIESHTKLADASLNTFELVDPIAAKCLNSLTTTQGCTQEVITSFFSCQVRLFGPSCCKALTAIDNSCWPKLFPFFPPLLKNYCTNQLPKENPSPSPIST
ncbi:egg cell-secreted-like protein [Thalictrum thalictroides]|uniref:Egg cell-secreted-like protein n=1 Tax=Thalictrum thalictroides TaxID=46969 RepID=A0A7J6WLT7_THATH|nr:egg cell-secreted-like protein [Thalictrum thalictroides]